MTNKYKNELVVESQIKITVILFISIRMTKIKNSNNIYCWWRHKEKNILLYSWGKCTVTKFLEKKSATSVKVETRYKL